VKEQRIKDVFAKIAEDEHRHADLVQKIINIASNAL
jgi:rubrerythrin